MMERTKAEFKATRERVGMSVSTLAKRLGVSERSIRYWERDDNYRVPPKDAWHELDNALDQQKRVVSFALGKVARVQGTLDGDLNAVQLPYWTCESDYQEHSTDANGVSGDWQMANANLRATAILLEQRGVKVRWVNGNPAARQE